MDLFVMRCAREERRIVIVRADPFPGRRLTGAVRSPHNGSQGARRSADDVRRTARDYDIPAEPFDGKGHDLTLWPGWERVADRADAWVGRVRSSTKDVAS